ncbi:MAG: hypothetical protein F6K24_54820 [Okeania sp. SIO2D1]|nr:hypothetical protein [Okeania sp. SIO2D1]
MINLEEGRSKKEEAVRPRVGDRRKRSDPATTPVARERRPREGMRTKRGRRKKEKVDGDSNPNKF